MDMQKCFSSLSKNRELLILIVFELLIFIGFLSFGNIKYEVSDDFIMELIFSKTYTDELSFRLLFSNSIYGMFLAGLYSLMPKISWYLVIQLLICLLSYICMAKLLLKKLPLLHACMVLLPITFLTAYDLYLLPQFTKTASVAITAGGLLFLHAAFEEKNPGDLLLGGFVFILGSMIRFIAIYTALPFFLLYSLYLFCSDRKQKLGKPVLHAAVLAILTLALRYTGLAITNSSEQYRYFTEWSAERSHFIDYSIPPEEYLSDTLKANDMTENDYRMLASWQYADEETLGINQLKAIREAINVYRETLHTDTETIFDTISQRGILLYPGCILCLILTLFCLLTKPKSTVIPAICIVILLAYFAYFISADRCVYRVECSFFINAAFTIAASLTLSDRTIRKNTYIISAVSLILSLLTAYAFRPVSFSGNESEYRDYILSTYYPSWNYDRQKYRKEIIPGTLYSDFVSYAQDNPEKLFIMEFDTVIQKLYYHFDPLQSASSQFPKNLFYMGGVTAYHPVMNEYIKSLGYASIPEALLQPNVYYVCNNNADLMLTYFHEHGHENVQMNLVTSIDGLDIWSFTD